ncbi:MAG: Gfo/Idh/MocA family oxidoreductase [Actinobacteria bacterium]|nr:Gfo/Idh/MocA family oxidoreductase [Actinomycetota bacterium]
MVHGPVLANSPHTTLTAVWARRREAAAKTADRNGAAVAATYEALLAQCDAVAFCVPPTVQAEMAVVAARAGKTLLLEKPIALELDAAERLVAAVEEAGVGTVVLLSWRFAQATGDFIAEVRGLGHLLGGRGMMVSGALLGDSPFATPWRLERGPLLDLGPHVVDLIDAAMGPVVGVKASGDLLGWVSLLLEHENGATSSVDMCATAGVASVSSVEVFSGSGSASLNCATVADATSMAKVPAALAAAAAGTPTDAPDIHRGLHLQRILSAAEAQLRA